MPVYSLVYPVFRYPVDQTLILLALQKTGRWYNYVNGFGGEVERGESYHACARRELKEEAGIVAEKGDLTLHGKILSYHEKHVWRPSYVYVYLYEWDGVLPEGGELERYLCPVQAKAVPYEKMPPHDNIWLPRILKGEFVETELTYETTDCDEYMLKSVVFDNNYAKPCSF